MNISEVIPIFATTSIVNEAKKMLRLTALLLNPFSGINKLYPVLFCLFFSNQSFGQTPRSYSGTIGKYPIYLQIKVKDGKASGYYFYKNKLIDISLSGTYQGGLVTLKATDEFGNAVTDPETLTFKWSNKILSGTWLQKGKSLPLKLSPLSAKETSSPKCLNTHLKKSNPITNDLTKVKIGLFKLKEVDSTRTINGIKIRFFKELNTEIELFRIDSGMTATKQKDANSYLEYLHLSEFLESLECASYSSYGSDFGYGIGDLTLSNDLICFSVFKTYYCGGAHPDEENYGINYDLNTQTKVHSSDYLMAANTTVFEERVYRYLTQRAPEYFNQSNESDSSNPDMDCAYSRKELWTTDCEFVFTANGIKLLPSFAHYAAFCLEPEWAVIPYSEIDDVIKPEYLSKLIRLKN